MPINDPLNNLEVLTEFKIPTLVGPQYDQMPQDVAACLRVPYQSPGPGGIRHRSSIEEVEKLLGCLQTLVEEMEFPEQNQLAQSLGFNPPLLLPNAIANAIAYVSYLGTRDELLQNAITGLMTNTK
jgi:hypothetical protein